MPVDDASYRAWDGQARPSAMASVAIASTMVRRLLRQRLLKALVIFAPVIACVVASLVFGLIAEGKVRIDGAGRPPSAPDIASAVRTMFGDSNLLAYLNRMFFPSLLSLAVIVAAFAGAPLIAEDRRSRSLALYFSRPIRHFDYVAGKFLTLFFFLGLFLLAPPICMYLTDCALSGEGTAAAHLGTFGRSLIPGAVACCLYGALAIGVSSLVERTNHAVLVFFGIIMLAFFAGNMLARGVFRDPSWLAVSPFSAIQRITSDVLPIPRQFVQDNYVASLDLSAAWWSVSLWTGGSLAMLIWRIRKVEVVA